MKHALFDARERAFEAKFAQDGENDFLVRTQGGALFVKWIASLLNLTEDAAAQQANRMIDAVMKGQSDKNILGMVSAELADKGQEYSPRQLATKLIQCREEARVKIYAS